METIKFMSSLLTFYLKGEIKLENNFLRLKKPNTLLALIPLGSRKHSIPINQISSVDSDFYFLFKRFILGFFTLIVGLALLSAKGIWILIGLVLICISAFLIIYSFQSELVIETTSGSSYRLDFIIFERKKAVAAENMINSLIGNRLNDTNIRIHSQNQTAELKASQAQNTQAIIDAINSNNPNK